MTHWLSTDQAAQYLGYREGTLRVWRAKDQGPAYTRTPSGSIRYRIEDLEAWLSEGSAA
ncbi:helix-turn-helix transcriptional regulator [Brachybacterium saurashtrense]|uniref:DNA-binding protein n=1 Tax=Brachybacterium saurashtrense TaxID=556288 RepID=A0A345YNJ1_9MICO|nr:DNA-binding protein [Brachybacterium saurashtrense]RRR21135.1 DNA-binding protein [Brachybacterium saurashtrense]